MSHDIFVSYSSSNRDFVRDLAVALNKQGWSVWWDRSILPGAIFTSEIEQALDAAACVIVVWSKTSAQSNWVRAEAAKAFEKRKLIPIRIDDIEPPLPFSQIHTENMAGWQPDKNHLGYKTLCSVLSKIIGTGNVKPDVTSSESSTSLVQIKASRPTEFAQVSVSLHVDSTGCSEFQTITAALEAASEGSEIIVHPGIYNEEELSIAKVIILRGEGKREEIRIRS
jgi:TIR domain